MPGDSWVAEEQSCLLSALSSASPFRCHIGGTLLQRLRSGCGALDGTCPLLQPLQLLWVRMGSLHATPQTSLPASSVQVLYALHTALLTCGGHVFEQQHLCGPWWGHQWEGDGCICLLLPATSERRRLVSGSQANLERFPSRASSLAESLAAGRVNHWRMARPARNAEHRRLLSLSSLHGVSIPQPSRAVSSSLMAACWWL